MALRTGVASDLTDMPSASSNRPITAFGRLALAAGNKRIDDHYATRVDATVSAREVCFTNSRSVPKEDCGRELAPD